jgi:signal transduction histidine kinase
MAIINDLLDFSKIEAGRMEIETVELDVRQIVREVAGLLRPVAQRQGLALGTVVDPRVPALLLGDPTRLRQVLLNLLGNALKFTESGSVGVRVTSGALWDTDQEPRAPLAVPPGSILTAHDSPVITFSVTDTGIGIHPSVQRLLFQPFSQADGSTTRRYGGTGLGLAISRRLVILMGGEIGVESEPGSGSTFWFTLPATVPPASPAAHSALPAPAGPPRADQDTASTNVMMNPVDLAPDVSVNPADRLPNVSVNPANLLPHGRVNPVDLLPTGM